MILHPKDLKEAASIERRRAINEQRKLTIFNHRNREIGIDCEALEKQIQERNAREEAELRESESQEAQSVRDAKCGILLERKHEEERRRQNAEINAFRFQHQSKESRREFDLDDRNAWKSSLPARLSDDDPRCGVSSAQKFSGEDLSCAQRHAAQRDQLRAWLEQQIAARREADADRKSKEAAYDETLLDRDRRACQLDLQEQLVRRQRQEAAQEYNKSLADETERRRQLARRSTREDDRAEVHNMVTGDLLTENTSSLSAFGPGRVIGYMYKGMTEEQRQEIRDFQHKQAQEKKTERALAERRDAEFDAAANGLAQHGTLRERELQRSQRTLDEKILGQNKKMSVQQKAHQRYLNEVVFTNKPEPSYFAQFNKTAR